MKIDGRKLDRDTQEHIRIMSCRRIKSGESVTVVMKSYGMSRTVYYRWSNRYSRGGIASLKTRKAHGNPRAVSSKYYRRIRKWISGHDPRDYGFCTALWTREIIRTLIEQRLGIRASLSAIGRLLSLLQITPQKPLRRAYERDETLIRKWKEETYPNIVKQARRNGSDIFFLDEAGVESDASLGRSWGERGRTPIVRISGQRQKVNAISAVSARGGFWFAVYSERLNAALFIKFLKQFLATRKQSVILIVDGHPAHRAKIVAQYVQSVKGRLQLVFLPPYAPDLNPDEFVWRQLKGHDLSKYPLRRAESLRLRVCGALRQIKKQTKLVQSFFKAPSVAYSLVA